MSPAAPSADGIDIAGALAWARARIDQMDARVLLRHVLQCPAARLVAWPEQTLATEDWAEYRAPEYAAIDPARTIAILPTAAVEQHGPHLPVGTDTMIAEGMLATLRRNCPDDLDIRILPVQAFKLDRSFVDGLPGTTADVAIVKAVFGLAESLGIEVVAEGVERADQQLALQAIGVRRMQGWLFARAMDQASLCALL